MKENSKEKRILRENYALKQIKEPVILNRKLLIKQKHTLSDISIITNETVYNDLVGIMQFVEVFEWLPKGEYTITVKIE